VATEYTQHTATTSLAYTELLRDLGAARTFWRPSSPTGEKHNTLAAVHRLGDVDKELPEDVEILDFLDADIPGLATKPER